MKYLFMITLNCSDAGIKCGDGSLNNLSKEYLPELKFSSGFTQVLASVNWVLEMWGTFNSSRVHQLKQGQM